MEAVTIPKKVENRRWAYRIFVLLFLLVAIAGGLFSYSRAYAGKIYRNVYAANLPLEGLSKAEAKSEIKEYFDQILGKEVTLKTTKKEYKVRLSDTGIYYDTDQIVEDSYSVGRGTSVWQVVSDMSQTLIRKEDVAIAPRINRKKYDNFIKITGMQLNIEPQDATLKIENGAVIETKEVDGQTVSNNGILPQLLEVASNPASNALEIEAKIVPAEKKSIDFAEAKATAEVWLSGTIVLSYEDHNYQPDRNEIARWITFSERGNKTTTALDDASIKAYLNKIARDFEIQVVNKKINAADGAVIVEGREGKYLNKDEAVNQIHERLTNGTQSQIAMTTYAKAPEEEKVFPEEGLTAGRFAGKYIDVDLAQQRLCLIDGNSVGQCYVVSTGKASTPTPIGTRYVDGKGERVWSAKYGLWMPWWQSLGGGYGIHELPEWPGGYKEGENHLGTPVSHGCIRLGVGPAQDVFNWTTEGTPVYIHK